MKKEIMKADITKAVKVSKNEAYVSSDFIADVFGKRHTHVLDKIRENIDNLAAENSVAKSYFINNSYIDSRGKNQPRYNLTRKGFDLLVLGMTGLKAFKYKVWFIDEFHSKAKLIAENNVLTQLNKQNDVWVGIRDETKPARDALTDAIQTYELPQRIEEGKAHDKFVAMRIINYTQMIYGILNITTSRDTLDMRTLYKLEDIEYKVAGQIEELTVNRNCHYKQTYRLIKKSLL